MNIVTVLLTAVAMAMDAFSVSVCKGLSIGGVKPRHMLITGAWFGGFQAAMPLIGYFLGSAFEKYITSVTPWIAFGLLFLLGANMIKEAFCGGDESADASLGFKVMLVMAIATSIDALAVGVAFAFDPKINIWFAVSSIGIITFALSAIGVKIGSVFGSKNKKYAELVGGIVLVLIGVEMLLDGLGIINF